MKKLACFLLPLSLAACGDDSGGSSGSGGSTSATTTSATGTSGSTTVSTGAGTGGSAGDGGSTGSTGTGGSSAEGTGAGGSTGAGGATSDNQVTDGATTYYFDTVGATFNAKDGSAGYLGVTSDFAHSLNLGAPSVGTFDPCYAMAYSNDGAQYSSAWAGSTCSVTVTEIPTGSGERFAGTYTATLFNSDGTASVTLTDGRFDAIFVE